MTDEIDRIVAGMTKAQREAVSGLLRSSATRGAAPFVSTFATTRLALTRKGLVSEIGRITDLGLAVRARLAGAGE